MQQSGVRILIILSLLLFLTAKVVPVFSQNIDEKIDSAQINKADSAAILSYKDTLQRGFLEIPVFSKARDSIVEVVSGKKMLYYYGDVTVTYGDTKIEAEYMAYDVDDQTVFASGIKDSTGNFTGKPKLTEGGQTYDMEKVIYNFKTQKARIRNVITTEQEGILHGENIKMMPDKSLNIAQGKYTVCDCPEPHYYLRMTAAKLMTEPKQKTVFGPAYVVVEDVPLFPLVLPFGFVPKKPERATGILFPTYGEEASRGFYLKDLGWYFVLGDYFDLALTTNIYTLGSWGVTANARYKLRYKFDGSLNVVYSKDITGDREASDYREISNFSFRWSHRQDSKARPGTSFNASVNFSSPLNNKYNNNGNVNQGLENQTSSSITYSRSWSALNFSINALHSQNTRGGDADYSITLPNFTLNVNRFYPFQNKNRIGKKRKIDEIYLTYGTTFQNKISFKASEFKTLDPLEVMRNGMAHKFQIGLPSFSLFKYINFSPSISYGMNWYFQEQNKYYDASSESVVSVVSPQFSTFGISQDYSGGISVSTNLYGRFRFGKKYLIQDMRHIISPQISFSFRPELGTSANGYRSFTYIDSNGNEKTEEYNIYSGFGGMYSPPGKGKTASMNFSIGNNLEAKVRDKRDTTGTGTKKIKLIEQLSFRSGYNFLAKEFKMENISSSFSTTLFQKLNLSGSMSFDPYAIENIDGRATRVNRFYVLETGKLARMTSANFSTGYSFSGKGTINGNDGQSGGGGGGNTSGAVNSAYRKSYYHPVTGEYVPDGWMYYINPNVPWSVNFTYSYTYSRTYVPANGELLAQHNHMQTMNISGQIKLTKDLNISASSGLDLSKMKLTTTQVSATYDLHCFQISFNFVPFGQWKQWGFRINAKASALADLLQYKRSSSMWDN